MPLPPNPYAAPVGLLLVNESNKKKRERFRAACEWWSEQACVPWSRIHEVNDLDDMLTPATQYPVGSVSQLAVFGHGIPEAFMRPGKFGVELRERRLEKFPKLFVSPRGFTEEWGRPMREGALVSLACCLTSRDPAWYRNRLFQKFKVDPSEWGPGAFADGGYQSAAAHLCRAFAAVGRHVTVRGHCAAGDTIAQALIREHVVGDGDAMGRSLWGRVFGPVVPDKPHRDAWHEAVKGEVAARWLLGLATTEETIRTVMDRYVLR